ncbi:hypothetical protein O6H91_07G017700 [Diphasiastrum complanatum]|uniref:Uncharacterized protein n=1 Tax=Diphasiastrum complanatum TaxID=34168 RepID=A0ACC2D2X6_DIPCM|nr:hypothetical protein O6H91_07G017700 [Diphasiastrum complanatum]
MQAFCETYQQTCLLQRAGTSMGCVFYLAMVCLVALSSTFSLVSTQISQPLTCLDPSRVCNAYLHYLLPLNKTLDDVQAFFSVGPKDILNETNPFSSPYPYIQSLFVRVECSCSDFAKQYFATTTYTPTTNATLASIIHGDYQGLAWAANDSVIVNGGMPVKLSLLCGCSSSDWNYLLSDVVTGGDTLALLADRFGSNVSAIQAANNISNDVIYNGEIYYIPINSFDAISNPLLAPTIAPSSPTIGMGLPKDNHHGGVSYEMLVIIIVGTSMILVGFLVIYILAKMLVSVRKVLQNGKRNEPNEMQKVNMREMHSKLNMEKKDSKSMSKRLLHRIASTSNMNNNTESLRHSSLSADMITNVVSVEKPIIFTYEEICVATEDFRETNMIGQGAYSSVFRGNLQDQEVAIKRMKATKSKEFLAELKVLSRVHHTNLVELIGYATSEEELFLVYEYAENGALSKHLHNPRAKGYTPFTWNARVQIALDTSRGLEYLHDHANAHYIHRDVKTSNILLDSFFRAKVADFGLAKLVQQIDDGEILITRVVGTFGYLAPEYRRDGQATAKSDVYAFGVVLFELITGQQAISKNTMDAETPRERRSIISLVLAALNGCSRSKVNILQEMVDQDLEGMYPIEGLYKMATLAKQCVEEDPCLRPDMKQVVFVLSQILFESIEWEATLAGGGQVFSGIFQGR